MVGLVPPRAEVGYGKRARGRMHQDPWGWYLHQDTAVVSSARVEGNADEGWVITCDNRRQWHPREWTFGILKGMDAEFLENMTEAVRECASGGTPIGCDSGCEH